MATRPSRFSVGQVREALEAACGIQMEAARILGCQKSMVGKYIQRYPTLRQAAKDIENLNLDKAETALHKAIEEGNVQAITFYLKTKGKGRGYSTRWELTGADGGPVQTRTEIVDVSNLSVEQLEALAGHGDGEDE